VHCPSENKPLQGEKETKGKRYREAKKRERATTNHEEGTARKGNESIALLVGVEV